MHPLQTPIEGKRTQAFGQRQTTRRFIGQDHFDDIRRQKHQAGNLGAVGVIDTLLRGQCLDAVGFVLIKSQNF